jgi:hypothetical protein
VLRSQTDQSWWKSSLCKHVKDFLVCGNHSYQAFLGEKKALSFEVAQYVSKLQYYPEEFDVNKKRVQEYPGVSPFLNFPRSFVSGKLVHLLWGANNVLGEDLFNFVYPFKAADILFICFSLVNRPSYEEIVKVTKPFLVFSYVADFSQLG